MSIQEQILAVGDKVNEELTRIYNAARRSDLAAAVTAFTALATLSAEGIAIEDDTNIDWIEVESSALSKIAYDETTRTLHVKFPGNTRRKYSYGAVPPAIWRGLLGARSKGQYFQSRIRFAFTEVA